MRGRTVLLILGVVAGLIGFGLTVGGGTLVWALGGGGVLLLGASAALLIIGLRRGAAGGDAEQAEPAPDTGAAPASAAPAGAYPVRLDGRLDPTLSRWLWLAKWLLVIPHAVALAFLWLAAVVLTAVAGFAILFTGRYPRSIFEFNVGVMRWTWRVSFYAIGAFGTDRYPLFSLRPDPGYPAHFDVDYPEHLSRRLVLVKWWLLALPHYLIVAVFAGGWGFGRDDAWRFVGSGGLIAIIALVAAAVLAVRGRYPNELFDFVIGLNRWCFRVLAYAALLRDEYPPFRLDAGGTDPGSRTGPREPAPPDRSGELVAAR